MSLRHWQQLPLPLRTHFFASSGSFEYEDIFHIQ